VANPIGDLHREVPLLRARSLVQRQLRAILEIGRLVLRGYFDNAFDLPKIGPQRAWAWAGPRPQPPSYAQHSSAGASAPAALVALVLGIQLPLQAVEGSCS
jgi:hypothetical protein